MREHSDRIPCVPETPCKLRETIGCREDIHHEAWPKPEYRTALEKKFRNHVMNKVIMCRAMHNEEHAQQLVPKKGTPEEMKRLMEEYDETIKRTT
jgi:hypothetical protein